MPPTRLTYQQIADDLIERIRRGEYPPGSVLPSYRKLADIYSVSISTALAAMRVVRQSGLTETVTGRGVYVVETT